MEETNEGGRVVQGRAAGQVPVAQLLDDDEVHGVAGDRRQIHIQTAAAAAAAAAASSEVADGSRTTYPNNEQQVDLNPTTATVPRPDVELVVEGVWLPYSGRRRMIEFAAELADLSMENFEV